MCPRPPSGKLFVVKAGHLFDDYRNVLYADEWKAEEALVREKLEREPDIVGL